MTIISNVMPLLGVSKTGTIPSLVLCRPLLTDNVRTANLITKAVKKTDRGLVVKLVTSTPVLRGGCMQLQTAANGILLTANAVLHHRQPAVRAVMP